MSLQDQLLKAGLVDKKSVNKANKERNRKQKKQRKTRQVEVDEVKLSAQQAREEKAEQDRILNQQLKAQADEKAVLAQIRQMIDLNKQRRDAEGVVYHFSDGAKVKQISVSDDMQKALSDGRLAIVSLAIDEYEVVPAVIAEKIAMRKADAVIVQNDKVEEVDEDDPYAAYEIPDDLMW